MSAPEKWRIEAVHASGCIHYTNEMACDCGLLEAARDTFPSPPSGGEVAALLRELREEGEAANRNQAASEDEYPLGFLSTHGDLCLRAADALARLSAPVPDTDVAQNDLRDILRAVGLSDCARPYSPHEVVQRELLPHLRALRNVIEKYDGNSNNPYWAEEFNQAVRIARAYLDKPIKADK